MAERSRRLAPILIAAVAGAALVVWLMRSPDIASKQAAHERASAEATPVSTPMRDEIPARNAPRVTPPEAATPADVAAEPASREEPAPSDEDSEAMDDAIAEAWAQVDLEEVHRAMPDNLYFKLSVPTKDEAVLADRAAERDRWNVEYGKMLSGTGTEEEIRAYYDHQARLSGDYVEFTTYLLDHYRDTLVPRDVALLELARRLHLARLEEIPRKVEEAHERKRQQDKARAEWLADEAAFGRDQGDAEEAERREPSR